jgi:putative aldouronate transport system substrate-binding protein
MIKRLTALVLSMALIFSFSGCAPKSSDSTSKSATSVLKDGNVKELTIVLPGSSSSPASLSKIEEQTNAIISKTMDAKIKYQILEWGVYADQMKLMLSSGADVDIIFTYDSSKTYANNGQVMAIDNYVSKYASDANNVMKDYIDACKLGGQLYGLPTFHEYTRKAGLVCRTDILKKLDIDSSAIKTWDDISSVLEKVHAAYPKMNVLVPPDEKSGLLEYYLTGTFDPLWNNTVGIKTDDSGCKVLNIFDTDNYLKCAKLAYDWNKKGYFIDDATTVTDTRQELVAAGNTFGFIGTIHPGTKTQETKNSGVDMTVCPVTESVLTTNDVNFAQYMVPTACTSPEKAVAFLNLLYTNKDIQNMFMYGIKGTDYTIKDESKDVVGYPEGVTAKTVGWSNEPWLSGNASISHVWETDPDTIWNDYEQFNSAATKSPLYGFSYDTSDVTTEITALQNVLTKYRAVIESGYSDPTAAVKKFNDELKAAGIEKMISDAQKQVDKWKP